MGGFIFEAKQKKEIEEAAVDETVSFLPFLRVFEEVTDTSDYYNSNISKRK